MSGYKEVRIGDFLTEEQAERCCDLYPDHKRIHDEVILPNLAEINRKLGQENDARYLSYAIVSLIHKHSAADWSN